MKLFNFEVNTKTQLLFAMFLTSLCAWFSAIATGDLSDKIFIILSTLGVFYITKPMWLPAGYGRSKVRVYSLTIASSVAIAGTSTNVIRNLSELLKNELPSNLSWIADFVSNLASSSIPWPILLFIFSVITVVNFSMKEPPVMGGNTSDFDKDIPEPEFKDRLKDAISSLRDDLYSMDKQTNWSGSFFTSLEAEVYKTTASGKKKKASDLMKALRNNDGRAFLILGDPGAGKSVALRKLAKDLLEEVKSARKIPIYINLKEWINTKWTPDNPPSIEELYDFVKDNIARRDLPLSIFVEKYFDRLYETKRLFFIFDSFDEIPQVMNVGDDALLIDLLSGVLYKFIKSEGNHTGGVVASRKFRKPTNSFEALTEIELRPFSDENILKSVKRQSGSDDSIINKIFERQDLFTIAKNPFMASMIATYIKLNKSLPDNQLDMFTVFIDNALTNSKRKLDEAGLDKKNILSAAKQIALKMFSNYGLEAPIIKIKKDLSGLDIESIVDCLKFARLIRSSSVDQGQISFVHRRFCEYFVVTDLLENNIEIPFNDIPKDSQWRDALVLYCEVAPYDKATAIAKQCWSIIKSSDDKEYLDIRSIHCMRFLRDAFKGRKDCISSFSDELNQFIQKQIDKDNNAYNVILSLELSGILPQHDIEENSLKAIKLNDFLIIQHAIQSCRYLHNISTDLEISIAHHINSLPIRLFLKNYSTNIFTFSISNAFNKIKLLMRFKLALTSLWIFFTIALFLNLPTISYIFIFSIILLLSTFTFIILKTSPILYLAIESEAFKKLMNTLFLNNKEKEKKKGNEINLLKFNPIHPNSNIFDDILKINIVLFNLLPIITTAFFILVLLISQKPAFLVIDNFISTASSNNFNFYIFSSLLVSASLVFLVSTLKLLVLFRYNPFANLGKHLAVALGFFFIIIIILYTIPELFNILGVTMAAITSPFLLFSFYKSTKIYFKVKKYLKTINVSDINSREEISKIIKETKSSPSQTNTFIDVLEANVTKINGDWPDVSILNLSNNYDVSRLAILDSRWKGID